MDLTHVFRVLYGTQIRDICLLIFVLHHVPVQQYICHVDPWTATRVVHLDSILFSNEIDADPADGLPISV